MTGTLLSNPLELGAIMLAVGAVSGITAGLLGVGGGIIIVPVLFHLFSEFGLDINLRMHIAVGTSLATIIATSIMSVRAHAKRGAVDQGLLRSWGPWIFLGVIIGSTVAGLVRGTVMSAVFATIALVVSLHMAFGRASWRIAEELPTGAVKAVMVTAIGAISAMMGIGGGTIAVPTLTLFGYPVHRAVGTAAALGLIIGVPGTIGFIIAGWDVANRPAFSLGYVNLLGVAALLPTSMLLAPVGARIAHGLNTKRLKQVFGAFLGVTAIRMFWGLLT